VGRTTTSNAEILVSIQQIHAENIASGYICSWLNHVIPHLMGNLNTFSIAKALRFPPAWEGRQQAMLKYWCLHETGLCEKHRQWLYLLMV